MPLPSLNLGQWAESADEYLLRAAGRSVGRTALHIGRTSALPLAKFGGKAVLGGALSVLGVGAAAVSTVAGLGYMGASLYNKVLAPPTFQAKSMFSPPSMQRGGRLVAWHKHGKIPLTNTNFYSPSVGARVGDIVGGASVLGGMARGVSDAWNGPRKNWNVTQALNTGALEVERDNFLGATGSLTLAMYRQRHGRPSPQEIRQSGFINTVSQVREPEVVHALHLAHMAAHG